MRKVRQTYGFSELVHVPAVVPEAIPVAVEGARQLLHQEDDVTMSERELGPPIDVAVHQSGQVVLGAQLADLRHHAVSGAAWRHLVQRGGGSGGG